MGNLVKKYFCFINKIQYSTSYKVLCNSDSYGYEPSDFKSHSIHGNGINKLFLKLVKGTAGYPVIVFLI